MEVAERIDQEVADTIAAGREYFLDHHESLRIDDTIFESLKDSVRHWYECEGGKYILEAVGSVVVAAAADRLRIQNWEYPPTDDLYLK